MPIPRGPTNFVHCAVALAIATNSPKPTDKKTNHALDVTNRAHNQEYRIFTEKRSRTAALGRNGGVTLQNNRGKSKSSLFIRTRVNRVAAIVPLGQNLQ
jgi:hypothetical protein